MKDSASKVLKAVLLLSALEGAVRPAVLMQVKSESQSGRCRALAWDQCCAQMQCFTAAGYQAIWAVWYGAVYADGILCAGEYFLWRR